MLQISKCGTQSVPPNLVLHTSLVQIRNHKARSFARPVVSLFQQKPTCLGPSMNVSNKQICTLLRQSCSKSDLVPSDTGLSCSFRHGVLIVSVLVLHPDSMISGSSFKSDSTYKYCQVQSTPTPNPQFNHTRLFFFLNLGIPGVLPCRLLRLWI